MSSLKDASPTQVENGNGLKILEEKLESLIETLRQIGIIVEDYQPLSQNILYSNLYSLLDVSIKTLLWLTIARNSVLELFREIDACRNGAQADIPFEVLS